MKCGSLICPLRYLENSLLWTEGLDLIPKRFNRVALGGAEGWI